MKSIALFLFGLLLGAAITAAILGRYQLQSHLQTDPSHHLWTVRLDRWTGQLYYDHE